MLVNFLIAGTQKGGTTALDAYLRLHPAIGMAQRKEAHFFDNEAHFQTGQPDYDTYHQLFSSCDEGVVFGEATPIYMYWRSAAPRIQAYNPEMKWILVLRNPLLRAYSHWNMETRRLAETEPFGEVIRQESVRCSSAAPLQHRVYSYLDRGLYFQQIQHLLHYFPRPQLHIINSDALRQCPQQTLQGICDFLAVDPLPFTEDLSRFEAPYSCAISRPDWDHMVEFFRADIRATEALLGWDCSDWLVWPRQHRVPDLRF